VKRVFPLLFLFVTSLLVVSSAQINQAPQHQTDKRLDGVNQRGDHAMGFSHEKTTHHFRLAVDGGSIEVTANDSNDTASLEQIRVHLEHIAKLFKAGDFDKPMFTHGEMPAGVSVMKRLKEEITYTFEPTEHGGRVRITTANSEAIAAVHEFLRYQIKDHKTGDSLEVK
jgi:hypothetical protein